MGKNLTHCANQSLIPFDTAGGWVSHAATAPVAAWLAHTDPPMDCDCGLLRVLPTIESVYILARDWCVCCQHCISVWLATLLLAGKQRVVGVPEAVELLASLCQACVECEENGGQ